MSSRGSLAGWTAVTPEEGEERDAPVFAPPTPQSVKRADQIITVLLGLVGFVVVVGTVGSLWDRGIRVDVALVTALLGALATYAIAGKFKDKQ